MSDTIKPPTLKKNNWILKFWSLAIANLQVWDFGIIKELIVS